MADKFARVTNIAAAFPGTAQVQCGSGWHEILVENLSASDYIEVSFDGTNVADRLVPTDPDKGARIFERVADAAGVWLRGPNLPSAKVSWE